MTRKARALIWLGLLLVTLGLGACSDDVVPDPAVPDPDLATIYVDLIGRLCEHARCGVRPVFIATSTLDPAVHEAVKTVYPKAEFLDGTFEVFDAEGEIRDGGSYFEFRAPAVRRPGVVSVDIWRSMSSGSGSGATYVYAWDPDDEVWRNVPPADVGITVTTAVS